MHHELNRDDLPNHPPALRSTPTKTYLEDEKAIVVQVDTLPLQEMGDLGKIGLAVIDKVVRFVTTVCRARDHKICSGNGFIVVVILNKVGVVYHHSNQLVCSPARHPYKRTSSS